MSGNEAFPPVARKQGQVINIARHESGSRYWRRLTGDKTSAGFLIRVSLFNQLPTEWPPTAECPRTHGILLSPDQAIALRDTLDEYIQENTFPVK